MKGTYETGAENYEKNKKDRKGGSNEGGGQREKEDAVRMRDGGQCGQERAGEASPGPGPSCCCSVSSLQNTRPDRPELPGPSAHSSLPVLWTFAATGSDRHPAATFPLGPVRAEPTADSYLDS